MASLQALLAAVQSKHKVDLQFDSSASAANAIKKDDVETMKVKETDSAASAANSIKKGDQIKNDVLEKTECETVALATQCDTVASATKSDIEEPCSPTSPATMDGETTVAPAPQFIDGAVGEARLAVASQHLRALTGCTLRDLVGMQLDLQRVETCEEVIKEVQRVVARAEVPVAVPKPKAASAAKAAASAAKAVPTAAKTMGARPPTKRCASQHAVLVGKLMRIGLSGV